MSYNLNEPSTFINIKLTDAGRRQLSLGKLTFNKAVLSDREVNYGIDRTGYYDILSNRILSPADYHPDIDPLNLDGTDAMLLTSQNVLSAKQFVTADTPSSGFFSGSVNSWSIETSKSLGTNSIAYASQTWNGTNITFANPGGSKFPAVGDLVFVPWVTPDHPTGSFSGTTVPSGTPLNALWYKVLSAVSATVVTVDRPIPRYSGSKTVTCFVYPYNGIETYYGSGQTQNTSGWNMNIVRTNTIAGTDESVQGISGYTRYGSIQYNGTKQYFGFSSETPTVGFVHYTNEFTGNTYGEQLIEGSVQIYAPMVMWHNIGADTGQGIAWGASFYDIYGTSVYDDIAKTTYRELRDGIASTSRVVGRVYHKLKLIVFTDQELLNILSYKANRNYSLSDFTVNLTSTPKYPLTNSRATGLCKKDYDYFITYVAESSAYSSGVSFGHPLSVHCGYIKKIPGAVDINGNPQYLQLSFYPNSFPYMRNAAALTASGHGWNANYVQILVSEQLSSLNYNVSDVPPTSWLRISSQASGGNGVYGVTGTTIDPLLLNGNSFIVSREDYNSGSTYTLYTGLTLNQDVLNFGSESMFHGVVDLQIFATTYKSIITVYATNTQINSSINSTYDDLLDENTYVSEIAILNDLDEVVAVGKPTYPIRKSQGRYLAFQLEIDF